MKKFLLLVVAVMFGFGTMSAKSVDVNTARTLGQKFVYANFENVNTTDLQLVTTVASDNGDDCFYVFNVGENGFVIISAADNYHPILAYSEESNFDMSNEHNGAMFMLENYRLDIANAITNGNAAMPEVAAEWAMLEKTGRLNTNRAEKVGPLCTTKWNQDSPYNYYAPTAAGGPGGRAYAGCVATAMSQVMKAWNAPTHGEGSHSYYCVGVGQLSANFGATTYQWDLMPNSLSNASQEQIEAVALLMYHCGVSVDMMFAADGSGAFSDDVPNAMRNYFDYDYCIKKMRQSYATDVWNQMLRDEFDLGRPVYYSGQGSGGGHAFVCDGYDENDLMHFNFGWSGSDDGWYLVDEIDYTGSAGAIFNYVPTNVYNNTVQAPTDMTVTRTNETAQSATLTWKNPSKTMSDVAVSSLDAVVVERNGKVIATLDAQVGANMTYVDENVPCYSTFTYTIYAMKDGVRGNYAEASEQFGPTTEWKVITTASSMQGWRGGSVKCFDAAGNMFAKVTMTNSTPATAKINAPFGHKVNFVWKAGSGYTDTETISIKIKNSEGVTVYEYSGNAKDLAEGVLCEEINNAGQTSSCAAPSNPTAERVGDDLVVSWDGEISGYGFNVYREGLLYALVHGNTFTDVAPEVGGYCYEICTFCNDGESAYTVEACGTAGEGCEPASDLWYEVQANGKPTITWTAAPETTLPLSGYYVYRKVNEDGTYERAKIVGANKTEYKETKAMEDGNWYYYKVVAYYQDIDCAAAPAKALYGTEFFVKYYYSVDAVEENELNGVSIYPNPAKDVLTIEAENISNVTIFNSLGQRVYAEDVNANEHLINISGFEAGIYMVKIVTNSGEVTKRISVAR